MKKHLLSMFALATMLLATSCSQEEEPIVNSANDYVEASFTVELSEAVQSRGLGEADLVNQLYYGIYQEGKVVPIITNVDDAAGNFNTVNVGEAVVENRTASVKVRLVKGQTYDFVFWAQVKDNKHYNINMDDLQNITVNYNGDANDETRDAFFAKELGYKVESHFTKTIVLKRPFAQVNVATTLADYKAAEILLGNKIKKSSLVVKQLPTTLNLLTGAVAGTAKDVEFNMALLPMDIPGLGNDYQMVQVDVNGDKEYATDGSEDFVHLSMNYLLADEKSGANTFLHEINVGFEDESGELINTINVGNLPAYRNYRTNIIGNILTTNGEFTIVIDEQFEKEEIIRELWDGESTEAVTPVEDENGVNVYEIANAEQLAWVAQQVNNKAKTFENEIVRLVADIYLNNQPWTPIGFEATTETSFKGTFDGNGKTIYDLNIVAEAASRGLTEYKGHSAGLFGYVSGGIIQNFTINGANVKHKGTGIGVVAGRIFSNNSQILGVTVKNAVVEGDHYVGGIVGHAYGIIQGCTVENATLTAIPDDTNNDGKYDNGDKVGGIVGYLAEGNYPVKNNTVSNVTITGYRELGGIVGCTKYASNITNNTVKGAIKVTAVRDIEYCKETEAKTDVIAGRIDEGSLDNSNDASEATYIEENTENDENPLATLLAEEGATVTIPAGEYVLPKTIADGVTIIGEEGTILNVAGASISADNVTIKNVVIQNNGQATTALALSGQNPVIENCVFMGAAGNGNGLVISGTDADNVITVRNCDFSQDDFFKPVFDGWNGLDGGTLLIENCRLANGLYTMHIDGNNESGKVIVKDSYLAGLTTNGASLESLTFENCVFDERAGYACANLYTSHTFINCTFPTKADANNVGNYGLYVASGAAGDDMVMENCKMSDGTPITIENVAVANGGFLHWDSDTEACYWTINGEKIANNAEQLKKYIADADNTSQTTIHLMEGTYTGAFDIATKNVVMKSSYATKTTIDGLVHALNDAQVVLRNLTLTNATPATSTSSRHNADYFCLGAYAADFIIEDCVFNISNQGKAAGKGGINIYAANNDTKQVLNGVTYELIIKNTIFNCNGERPIRCFTNSYIDNCTFNDQYRYAVQVRANTQFSGKETVTFANNKIVAPVTTTESYIANVSVSSNGVCEGVAFNISGNTYEQGASSFTGVKTLVYDNVEGVKITTCTLNNKPILESQCVKVDDEVSEVKE